MKPSERIHPAKAAPTVNVFLLEILDELHEENQKLKKAIGVMVGIYPISPVKRVEYAEDIEWLVSFVSEAHN